MDSLVRVNTVPYGDGMATKDNLTAEDWIKAAFRALTKGGVQAVRAEALARDLKVSKGSFYWHFKNVPALKEAMLTHWVVVATHGMITQINAQNLAPLARLKLLVTLATDDRSVDYGGSAAEMAIRDWGRYDENVRVILAKVEMARLAFVQSVFEEAGAGGLEAKASARILYGALIGMEHLSLVDDQSARDALIDLVDVLLPRAVA